MEKIWVNWKGNDERESKYMLRFSWHAAPPFFGALKEGKLEAAWRINLGWFILSTVETNTSRCYIRVIRMYLVPGFSLLWDINSGTGWHQLCIYLGFWPFSWWKPRTDESSRQWSECMIAWNWCCHDLFRIDNFDWSMCECQPASDAVILQYEGIIFVSLS